MPPNWKLHITAIIGALVALNSQLHFVTQNVQDALLAAAISLGFYAVNSNQTMQYEKLRVHMTSFGAKPPERGKSVAEG